MREFEEVNCALDKIQTYVNRAVHEYKELKRREFIESVGAALIAGIVIGTVLLGVLMLI